MKSYLSFVSSTVLSGTLKLFTMCIQVTAFAATVGAAREAAAE